MQQRKSVSSGTSHSGCAGNRTDHQLAQRIFRTQDDATVVFPSGDGSTLEGAPGDALLDCLGLRGSSEVSEGREAARKVAPPDACGDY
jgi:hypothetical protein